MGRHLVFAVDVGVDVGRDVQGPGFEVSLIGSLFEDRGGEQRWMKFGEERS